MSPPKSILQLSVLWLLVFVLSAFTAILAAASSKPVSSSCAFNVKLAPNKHNMTSVFDEEPCGFRRDLASPVLQYPTYLQAAHSQIVQAIVAYCLFSLRPALLAMTWANLESRTSLTTMAMLQTGMELSQTPSLCPALSYAKASKRLLSPSSFVVVVSLLSICAPMVVSPIYRPHEGPYRTYANLVLGGGQGPGTPTSYSGNTAASGAVIAGRNFLNANRSALSIAPFRAVTFDIGAAPFIPRDSAQAIWDATVMTVVAYNSLDCGPAVSTRLLLRPGDDIVSVDPSYWSVNFTEVAPLIAGRNFGKITSDARISVVYLNNTNDESAGDVTATTSIVFLAVNGTIDGAQQRVNSPSLTSRVKFIDVLVCTSTTKLVTSNCHISLGNVEKCTAVPYSDLPLDESGKKSLKVYVKEPRSVAATLAASPVWAYYSRSGRLPMYDDVKPLVESNIPPVSFLTSDAGPVVYHVPMAYVKDVLFGQTSQALAQGMLTSSWRRTFHLPFNRTATFSISHLPLLYALLGLCVACAVATTLWSTIPASSRHATTLDATRLVAISRNPRLDAAFGRYADRRVEVENRVLESKVDYVWVEQLGRKTLVVGDGANLPEAPEEKAKESEIWGVDVKGNNSETKSLIWP